MHTRKLDSDLTRLCCGQKTPASGAMGSASLSMQIIVSRLAVAVVSADQGIDHIARSVRSGQMMSVEPGARAKRMHMSHMCAQGALQGAPKKKKIESDARGL
jgi:hypothetical protein